MDSTSKDSAMKITNPYGPNTTLLLPGSCNASCSFCFWNQSEAKIRQPDNYTEKVFSTIENLPEEFRTLSLSGGEPTLSPYFGRVLAALGKFRRGNHLDRVVLTTHGGNLAPFITAVGCVVDHINISRHEIGYHANVSVFKTTNIPTDEELTGMIKKIHTETSCDVTLNCVIPADH
jgi:molybdenum cofactor biosynthesis enzyme MoaA